MNKSQKARDRGAPSQLTTVFSSGNSQAVRLPKAFRFDEKMVEIRRHGDEVILRPHRATLAEVLADLPPLSQEQAAQWDEVMAEVRTDLGEPREHDWSWMSDDESAPAKPRRRGSARATKARTPTSGKRRS